MRQTSAEAVGPSNDDAVIHAEFLKRHTNRAEFLNKVFAWNSYLAILVAALFGVRHLVLNLNAASTGLDQLFGEQVRRVDVPKPGINICDDRADIAFKIVDLFNDRWLIRVICVFQLCEEIVQIDFVGLAQGGVNLLDEIGDRCFLMHGLIRQMAK